MSDDYSPFSPRITGGHNVAVETTPDGFRINLRPPVVPVYNGFFLVRPFPDYLESSPTRAVQVVNGLLPNEDALTNPAGYVLIDRVYYVPEEDGGPRIEAWRLPVTVPAAASLSITQSATVYLQISAHHYKGTANYYPEAGGGYVTFSSTYHVLARKPESSLGNIYLPLADIDYDEETRTFAVTQLSWGVPTGTIARYNNVGPEASDDE